MYEQFFGFTKSPFHVTPDTTFLYPSPQHEGILQVLSYGISDRKGFLLLTGEVGTGKTTTIRSLVNILGTDIQTSLILNPLLSTDELLDSIIKDFGCQKISSSVADKIQFLNHFLLENERAGKNAVVIIDEAQNLSFEALEMARLLSNLETETRKLLQVLLVGQPELENKLAKPELRQLSQRIQIYCQLSPLDALHTEHYIHHRIQRAGHSPSISFEKEALREIYKVTGGIPRMINTLCEMTLLSAYVRQLRSITKNIVQMASKEVPFHVYHS